MPQRIKPRINYLRVFEFVGITADNIAVDYQRSTVFVIEDLAYQKGVESR